MSQKKRNNKSYRKNKEKILLANFELYGQYKCECCKKAPLYRNSNGETKMRHDLATVDHIIELSKGGDNILSNLEVLCFECNNQKSNPAANSNCKAVTNISSINPFNDIFSYHIGSAS